MQGLLTALTIGALGLIAYSYILLPVLLTLAARLRRREPEIASSSKQELPRIAVVVAAYNEAGTISHLIRSCLELDYPADRLRLFLGDDGSADGTAKEAQSFHDPRVEVKSYKERRGKISVLNSLMVDAGFKKFDAPIVLFCDAKSVLSHNLLKDIAPYFHDNRTGCVACKLVMEGEAGKAEGEGLYWKYEMHLKSMEDALGSVMGCNGGGFAMRTELYEPIPAGTIVEDFVISLKALIRGYTIRFAKTAIVRQPACADVHAEWVRKVRIGAGNFQAIRLCAPLLSPAKGIPALVFWGHKILRWFTPFLLAISWISSSVALFIGASSLAWLHAANLALGGFVVISSAMSWKWARVPAPIRLAGYFGIMNLALVAGFFRWIFRAQKVTWERADRKWTAPVGGGA